ncbi:MAG TPA: DUF2325 domain-containing protein [Synergistaceae bacterium]|nr:DUF2325 domain-containing protein [Synergistaceae bacterium]HPJ26824.1 DUF2325 domain-containing protein [Synergistaceae bacterium]HPQ37772.1 DUF2325 domain-containing protein [Synergistaceae bacterium]
MEHAPLENQRINKIWEYDCLMICTLLGLSLSNREIGELCSKYGLLSEDDAEDPSLGFYALHHACHGEEGAVPRFLSRNFSLKYRAFRKALEEHEDDSVLNLTEFLPKPHPKALGGALWATLNDPRKSVQAQGIYGAHKIVLNALREYQAKVMGQEAKKAVSQKTSSEENLSREKTADGSRKEMEKLRRKNRELEKKLALQGEEIRKRELSFGEEKEKLIAAYEGKISKLRRQIRLLEYSPEESSSRTVEGTPSSSERFCTSSPFSCTSRTKAGPLSSADFSTPPCHSPGKCPFCMLSNTTISVIGGLSRLEQQYRGVVERLGARCRYHCGNCQQGGKNLKQMIQSSDRVVFITSINSHNALKVAKGICKKEGKPLHLLKETSPTALEKMFSPQSSDDLSFETPDLQEQEGP